MFLPLVIKVFRCLHQQVDEFLHWCANMAWEAKGTWRFPFLVLSTFYRLKVSMVLHHAQIMFILKCVVVGGEGSSRLGILLKGLPFSLFDMLFATKGGWGTWCSLVVCPLLVVLWYSWTWIFPFYSLYSLLFSVLIYLWW